MTAMARESGPRLMRIAIIASVIVHLALFAVAGRVGFARGEDMDPAELAVFNVEMAESEFVLQGHTISLDETAMSGWGRVELPADSNPLDSLCYFVFADPPERRTVIVSDDQRSAEPLRLAAVSPVDPALSYSATVLKPIGAHEIDWDNASLILWHAPLPDGIVAQQMEGFVEGGKLALDGIFACNDRSSLGMLAALEDLRKSGVEMNVKFVGFDFSPRLVDSLQGGKIDALVVQDPRRMGYLAVTTLVAHLRGEPVEPVIDTGVQVATAERLAADEALRQLVGAGQ